MAMIASASTLSMASAAKESYPWGIAMPLVHCPCASKVMLHIPEQAWVVSRLHVHIWWGPFNPPLADILPLTPILYPPG